ncbi:MAG: ribose-5-phosphate isomerase RpiA [Bacteroidota bacterium]
MAGKHDSAKQAAALVAAEAIEDHMVVGLGTGSTASLALEEIARRIAQEGLSITGIATSYASEILADRLSIPRRDLRDIARIDLTLDGADEVDPHLQLIKGRGAAHTREKIVASLSDRLIILVDESKRVDRLGQHMPVPIEVVPMAVYPLMRKLDTLGAQSVLRMGQRKDGPVVTDQGLWIVDARFERIDDLYTLDRDLLLTPGVLDHGLFLNLATDVIVGHEDGSTTHLRRDA